MKKLLLYVVIISMLCFSMSGAVGFSIHTNKTIEKSSDKSVLLEDSSQTLEKYSNYFINENNKEKKQIDMPWINVNSDILEWQIRLEYNGETFEQQVPVDITDFQEKFLKHPEYGEILRFNVDDDPEDDVEIKIGFYWSIINDPDAGEIKSLEKRFQVKLLETGNYVDDGDGEFEIWSELNVNYGLIKEKSKSISSKPVSPFLKNLFESFTNSKIFSFIRNIIEKNRAKDSNDNEEYYATSSDDDRITVGAGFRSPQGEEIPRYIEKRFAFAKSNLFSPTIFQHQMDPGSSKGKGPFELLYGFRSFTAGSNNPAYDIEFSVEFNPAVFLKTKFKPLGGYVYYFFNQDSKRNTDTAVTFSSNILQGSGEDIELSLIFDKIDDSLGLSGRWMSFDIDMFGDKELLGGSFHYDASDKFTIGVMVDSPVFKEKVELLGIPTSVDCSWDLDFVLTPTPILYASADGYVDLTMSSDFDGINIYYPKSDSAIEDKIFIDVPGGIPRSTRLEAAVTLNVDLGNLRNPLNYVYGKLKHTCSSNVDSIRAFLPDEETPIVKVTEIPAYSEAKGKLYWNTLEGYAYAWRGSSGPPDPVEVNLEYKGYKIHDILTIRDGHIDTRFKVAEDGHFYLDTSEGIFGNDLEVSNADTGDSISLFVDEVSADELNADWAIDTSGDKIKINELRFGGIVDTLDGLQLDLDYKGKTTSLELDWILRKEGRFEIFVDQEEDLVIDFSQFAQEGSDFDLDGGIRISDDIKLDMSWKLHQGEKDGGSIDPGYFTINENNDQSIIKDFDFYLTYQDKYGINVEFDNLQFYLDLEWWKGDRLLPYVWLDYEVSTSSFDVDLLWTNREGETQWYENVENW